MAFRTILSVTGPDYGDGDLKLAAELCGEADAHLSILVAALAAPPPVGAYAAVVSDIWVQERQADMERLAARAGAVTALLAGLAVPADVATEYSEVGRADDVIGRRGRYADLTLVGPDMLAGERLKEKVIEGALFHSGRPALFVPQGARAALKPERVLVAWDGGIEAARAVREALPLLAGAHEVRLVLVDPQTGEFDHGDEPGADAAAYLARHGVKVAVDRLPTSGNTVADVLRRHAVDTGAELLVMGAYGHSRLRQRIFGGVTLSILEEPPLPVLMAR